MVGSWLCLTFLKYIFEFMMNFRVPSRVCDVEGGAVCSKNAAFGYFDGTAWAPRLLSPTALMAPVMLILKLDLLTSQAFERVARLWARSAIVRARSASERKLRVLPHQTRKPSERLWESLYLSELGVEIKPNSATGN